MEKKKTSLWRRGLSLVLALSLIAGTFLLLPTKAADTSDLGQLIDYFKANSSTFTLSADSRFYVVSEELSDDLSQTLQLSQRQFAADGYTMKIVYYKDASKLSDGDILVNMVSANELKNLVNNCTYETYHLEVGPRTTVTACDVDGLLYGLNMLQKHFRNAKESTIKGFTAYDTPDTKERAVHLDIARKYLSKDWICNFIKEMSWMGYNAIELHLSEDGGFRSDFWGDETLFKSPTGNDFSWAVGSYPQTWCYDPYDEDPDQGKHLTTAELVEICQTAKEYHLDVIPSFDTPHHVDWITKIYCNYFGFTGKDASGRVINPYTNEAISNTFKYNGTTYTLPSTGIHYRTNGYDCLDLSSDAVQKFSFALHTDIAAFFKQYAGSTHFNICGDEVPLKRSDKWTYADFVTYVNSLNALLKGNGENPEYEVRMYNDFIYRQDYINACSETVPALDTDIAISLWDIPNGTPNNAIFNQRNIRTADYYIGKGHKIYSGVQNWTYYVLRVFNAPGYTSDTNFGKEARDPTNTWWSFYKNGEDSIYNEWTPTRMSETNSTSDYYYSGNLLAGGYFYIWCDYASVNTENEMWNGVWDSTTSSNKGKYFYSLRKRMWSNSIKQWNWDINSGTNALSFAYFEDIRDTLGDFPGLTTTTYDNGTDYASATSLPAATAPIKLGDHTELTKALADGKIDKGYYTNISYTAYETAYNNAVDTNDNRNASEAELNAALSNLKTAISNLEEKQYTIKFECWANVGGIDTLITSFASKVNVSSSTYKVFMDPIPGYSFQRSDECIFTPFASGDGSGWLTGTVTGDAVVKLWFDSAVDTSRLDLLIESAITSQNITDSAAYTNSSWNAYTTALNNAKRFSVTASTKQSEVDSLIRALEQASSALVVDCKDAYLEIEFLNENFYLNSQVGMHIKTSPNIKSITISRVGTDKNGEKIYYPETLTFSSGKVQVLKDGSIVKFWNVFFMLKVSGDYEVFANYTDGTTEKYVSTIVDPTIKTAPYGAVFLL